MAQVYQNESYENPLMPLIGAVKEFKATLEYSIRPLSGHELNQLTTYLNQRLAYICDGYRRCVGVAPVVWFRDEHDGYFRMLPGNDAGAWILSAMQTIDQIEAKYAPAEPPVPQHTVDDLLGMILAKQAPVQRDIRDRARSSR